MLEYGFCLGWIFIQITLLDLLDLRYSKEREIRLLPFINIIVSGESNTRIYMLALGWLNLELSIMALDIDHYLDMFEDAIEKKQQEEQDQNNDS